MSETTLYTLSQVKEHHTNKSAWLAIHNSVFDVTQFLNEHPGGEEVLLEQAGRDATEAFEDVGHSSDARELMKKYKIGEIVESERRKVPEKSQPDWAAQTKTEENSLKTWLIPLVLGIVATVIYRFYFVQQ